ncbi:MAG: hypothetical protein ACOC2H_08805 [Spirochaetota bacterium]
MLRDYADNRIIQLLVAQNSFGEDALKRAYRALCMATHPDRGGSTADFIRLSEEYEQAKSGLPLLEKYISSISSLSSGETLLQYPRLSFYLSLKRYAAMGLYSVKVRLRENLRERNRVIIEEVIRKSQSYDESFIPVFIAYNRNHLKRYNLWLVEKNFRSGRKYFIKGLNFFLEYQFRGGRELSNIAISYLNDAAYELDHSEESPVQRATYNMVLWLKSEMEKPSLHFELARPRQENC